MTKPCPGCGVIPVPEARFCRLCGAPLGDHTRREHDAPVSPHAQTMPLTGEGRSTVGLSSDEAHHGVAETAKVGQKEIESILRRVQDEYGNGGHGATAVQPPPTTAPAGPQTTTLVPKAEEVESSPSTSVATAPSPSTIVQPVAVPATNTRARRMWQVAAIALLCVAVIAGALAFILSRKATLSESGAAAPISISDQKQLASEKMAEAETLLTAGEFNHAVDVLRVAVKLDPSNADAHMRLGAALEKTGARGEAIEEYRIATQNEPNAATVWKALASAQFEEKLYGDAAESYRRLLAANGNNLDDADWLAYADALRLAGRTEEARAAYQKISTSANAEIQRSSRRHLAELGPLVVATNADQHREAPAQADGDSKTPASAAAPVPSVAAVSTPGSVTTAAPVDFDTYYFQAINVMNGRDPRQMERAELLRALVLFQRAAQGGSHRAEAQGYVNRLGREYDRRKKW